VDASVDADVLAEVRRLVAAEDDTLAAVRSRAEQGARVPTPEVGAFLRWAAASVAARTVVEIGAAGGLTGLWLLRGMEERGVLTSVEQDPHQHGLATTAYADAGLTERVRSILGDPGAVLPRLSDDGYQLCLIQGKPADYPSYLDHALRLVRPGGLIVARDVLVGGASAADPLAVFTERLATDERLLTTVLPIDGGLALASLRGEA
jgi:predicted O-methyltransferase YrrM